MPPIVTSTPPRQSIINSSMRSSIRYHPNSSIASNFQVNDDEAERASRRSTMNDTGTEINLTEENAQVSSFLRMYNENKFNKDNVWNVQLIDHFSNLVSKHHKSMANFQVAGSTLEASAKVYVLRVDSLHQDTLRMVSNLSRQSARQLDTANDGEDAEDLENNDADKENQNTNGENTGKKKEKRKRRSAAVVTKNPDSLNSKLDTNPFTDPFFAKLNSIVGDINSSSRLMQNIIGTKKGSLQLRMDTPFWDPTPAHSVLYKNEEDYENREIVRINIVNANQNHALHHQLKGYSISEMPAEDDPDEEMPPLNNSLNNSSFHDKSLHNHSGAGVVFDPNAEVEPIESENNFMIDFGHQDDDNGFEQLEVEDREAIMRCRGIRRDAIIIEDMKPVDATSGHLEYSYRPLDVISQFWAGPSHWKFRQTRSMVKKSFTSTNQGELDAHVTGNKKKTTRKKKVHVLVTAEELFNEITDAFTDRNTEKPLKGITYSRAHISRKWNAKRLRLPTIMKIEPNVFDKFIFGPQLRPMNEEEKEPELDVQQYDYNNEVDNEYCREINVEMDADTETDFGGGDADNINTSDERVLSPTMLKTPLNQTVDFIGKDFEGAPEKVEKIMISYAKRAKPVDMKQLKTQCWNLIDDMTKYHSKNNIPTSNGEIMTQVEFKEVYNKLPRILTKSMAENISTGLVFYSVLHLANEKGLRVVAHENLDGCTLQKLNDFLSHKS